MIAHGGEGLPLAGRGLVLDWGGVLTADLDRSMSAWAGRDGVRYEDFVAVLDAWLGRVPAAGDPPPAALTDAVGGDAEPEAGPSPVHLLELGELEPAAFEEILAEELARRGSPVTAAGLLERMLGDLAELDARMLGLVRAVRAAGARTALLSNSWGEHYPQEIFDGMFDAVVISGRVGMRKPDQEIFEYTAAQLGLPASACVMVDDLRANVLAAARAGMVGVLHTGVDATIDELEILLGCPLRGPVPDP